MMTLALSPTEICKYPRIIYKSQTFVNPHWYHGNQSDFRSRLGFMLVGGYLQMSVGFTNIGGDLLMPPQLVLRCPFCEHFQRQGMT